MEYRGTAVDGVGNFTAERIGHEIVVKVKVKFETKNTETTVLNEARNGFIKQTLDWTGSQAPDFQREFARKIPEFWNGRWKFQRGGEVVTPTFVVEFVDAGEHLKLVCAKGAVASGLQIGPIYLLLSEFDNVSVGSRGAASVEKNGGIMNNQLTKLENAMLPVAKITVARGNPWTVDASCVAELNRFSQVLANIQPNGNPFQAPTPPLYIEATSGMPGKASQMVDAVYDHLQRQGVRTYPLNKLPTKTGRKWKNPFSSSHKAAGTVSIRFQETGDYQAANTWISPYTVSIHEFGHCFGLPDEYTGDYGGTLGTKLHDTWRGLCREAGVEANACGKFNDSIMSYGWVTSACHYVTVWDALRQITGGAKWNIVRGTEAG